MAYMDEVALPGLRLAHRDAERGALTPERMERLEASVAELLENLSYYDESTRQRHGRSGGGSGAGGRGEAAGVLSGDRPGPVAARWREGVPILCIAVRSPLDHAAADIASHILTRHGLASRTARAEDIPPASEATGVDDELRGGDPLLARNPLSRPVALFGAPDSQATAPCTHHSGRMGRTENPALRVTMEETGKWMLSLRGWRMWFPNSPASLRVTWRTPRPADPARRRTEGRPRLHWRDGASRSQKRRGAPKGAPSFFKTLELEWSERRDLNPRPLVPQTSALTGLRYAPTWSGPLEHDGRGGKPFTAQIRGQHGTPRPGTVRNSVRNYLILNGFVDFNPFAPASVTRAAAPAVHASSGALPHPVIYLGGMGRHAASSRVHSANALRFPAYSQNRIIRKCCRHLQNRSLQPIFP